MQKQAEKLRVQSNETGFNSVVHQLQGMIAGLVQVKGSCETLNHQVAELIEATRQRADELERQKAEQNAALAAAVNRSLSFTGLSTRAWLTAKASGPHFLLPHSFCLKSHYFILQIQSWECL